ncbi:hypothetical protein BDN70DRAFT_938255 [Pholiota conissans]|uniref:Uncharacterized protein n=1 Tax=Pholiota conissans TaxID=109636 RepID=A0A9P6CN15_9AGAR|nr:hypothetical protein BDN70DRAFT_938255 [Pholiota conissans]
MSSPLPHNFQAIYNLLHRSDTFQQEDIEDDLAGEKETLPDLTEADLKTMTPSVSTPSLNAGTPGKAWRENVVNASKAITDRTEADYRRYASISVSLFNSLTRSQAWPSNAESTSLSTGSLQQKMSFSAAAHPKMLPFLSSLGSWICDEMNPLDGSERPVDATPKSYGYAQKLRAAMTHIFGRTFQLGTTIWTENLETGAAWGNPSVSHQVSSYMVSLRNRKARTGSTPTSARAITWTTLQMLYDYNHQPENWDPKVYDPSHLSSLNQWGGPLARRELEAIYTIAFLCLLRSDEVLKIQLKHVSFSKDPPTMTLTLPFRKTHQDGGIKPFVLYALDEDEAYLCPVRALGEWIKASKITSGFLFRKLASGDRPSAHGDAAMTSEQFLELFRNNLLDVSVDSAAYAFANGVDGALSSRT